MVRYVKKPHTVKGYTTKNGTYINPYTRQQRFLSDEDRNARNSIRSKHILFSTEQLNRYSKLLKFDNSENAKQTIQQLDNEFETGDNLTKLRVANVSQFAVNKCEAALRRNDLSNTERMEYEQMYDLYNDFAKKNWERIRNLQP